jgi:alpha-beta hydrolase superfamily lysophospholipase
VRVDGYAVTVVARGATTLRKRIPAVKRLLPWALAALLVLVFAYLGVGLYVASDLSAPYRSPEEHTPAEEGLDYQMVKVQSTDGLDLEGWWVSIPGSSRAVILVPGFMANKSGPYVLETAAIYAKAGYSVLMVDTRAQGHSEGNRITLGYREIRDVRGALLWLGKRGFEPRDIVLHGWSMGGATVVRAAPGTGVSAVVEDSGYADLPLLLRRALPEASGLPSFFNPAIMLAAKYFLGLDAWAVRPKEEARELSEEGVPLLIIHSTTDQTVPYEHARLFKAAYPRAELWRIKGYEHAEAYTDPRYREKLLSFLRRVQAKGKP